MGWQPPLIDVQWSLSNYCDFIGQANYCQACWESPSFFQHFIQIHTRTQSAVFAVCQGTVSCWGAAAIRQCCCDEGLHLVHNSVWIGGACQLAFTWMQSPMVSQQMCWDDQCYLHHLSVILMLCNNNMKPTCFHWQVQHLQTPSGCCLNPNTRFVPTNRD